MTVEFDVTGQTRTLAGEDLGALRLGYAQHIHRAQGATVTRTLVVTGGWQTSKEPAYVEASRAREGTDWFVSREDLGARGHGLRSDRAARREDVAADAQIPSLEHPEVADAAYGPGFDLPVAPSRSAAAGPRRAHRARRTAAATQERPR